MASDALIEIEGVVKEVYPGGNFLVETEAGTDVPAHERERAAGRSFGGSGRVRIGAPLRVSFLGVGCGEPERRFPTFQPIPVKRNSLLKI